MSVRNYAAPPTPRAKALTEPEIHETAFVHSFSNLIGDVRIGANVTIAPGTSIRADEGNPFHIGVGSKVQDGVVIHGLEQGRVLGDDGSPYSVWIGDGTSVTHMALIHGPAYIGDHCFIGFRSTVFNARIGEGSIVMMHALIQDVEVPPGKFVPSGSVITSQQQADRLPDVQDVDRQFAAHVAGSSHALRLGYQGTEEAARIAASGHGDLNTATAADLSGEGGSDSNLAKGGSMVTDVVSHVRQLLAQGYRIGTEHADERRFQTSSWKSCAPIQANREGDVLAALESCLADHAGEYVRLIGIDSKAKKRVFETIIQRPGDAPGQGLKGAGGAPSGYRPASSSRGTSFASSNGQVSSGGLGGDVVGQIRQLLAQGARIGMEHADVRRFQTSSWTSCSPIQSTRESDVLAGLESCLREHAGEYVRVIGIDPKAKRRIAEVIVQRPNGQASKQSSSVSSQPAPAYSGGSSGFQRPSSGAAIGQDVAQQVGQLLAQGYVVGLEYADERRFRTSSWQSAAIAQSRRESDILASIQGFLSEHHGDYVRLVGIDPKVKRRVSEHIIHRPNGKGNGAPAPKAAASSASYSAPAASYGASPAYGASSSSGSANGAGHLNGAVVDQVRHLLAQGYRIGIEYADERRFKTSSWQSGGAIQASRDSEVLAALTAFLNEHGGEYVRLIGIDPKVKRRVAETVIHQPAKQTVGR